MKTGADLTAANASVMPAIGADPAREALAMLLADTRSDETRRAYERDLRDFFAWRGCEATPQAVGALCALETGPMQYIYDDRCGVAS